MTRDKVLDFIKTYTQQNGYPPSFREIQKGVGIALSGVAYHLDRLEADKVIEREFNSPRTIRIVEQ